MCLWTTNNNADSISGNKGIAQSAGPLDQEQESSSAVVGIELAGTQPRQASHYNEPTSGRRRRRRSDWVHKAKLILSQNDLILALDQLTGTVELVYDYSLRPSRASPVSSSPTVTAVTAHNQKPSLLSSAAAAAAIQRPLDCVLANRLQLAETTDVTCWLHVLYNCRVTDEPERASTVWLRWTAVETMVNRIIYGIGEKFIRKTSLSTFITLQ